MSNKYKTYKGYIIPDNILMVAKPYSNDCLNIQSLGISCRYISCEKCILFKPNRDYYFEYVQIKLREEKLGRILNGM